MLLLIKNAVILLDTVFTIYKRAAGVLGRMTHLWASFLWIFPPTPAPILYRGMALTVCITLSTFLTRPFRFSSFGRLFQCTHEATPQLEAYMSNNLGMRIAENMDDFGHCFNLL